MDRRSEEIKIDIAEQIRNDGLTEAEGKIMDNLIAAWNGFVKLERTHPSELSAFGDSIHRCQQQLCMRVMQRDYPEAYPTYKNK